MEVKELIKLSKNSQDKPIKLKLCNRKAGGEVYVLRDIVDTGIVESGDEEYLILFYEENRIVVNTN